MQQLLTGYASDVSLSPMVESSSALAPEAGHRWT
jgi:hypothetical protein